MAGKVVAEVWLDVRPFNGGPGIGPGPIAGGTGSGGSFQNVQEALNQGIIIDQVDGGITFLGQGSIKGGKTSYDVGSGFWLGGDGDTDLYYKVAIGDPNGDTFNWDGQEINSKMNNLELRGYLRGPSAFVIDPATHGDNTGEVIIAGNLEVAGGTIQGPSDLLIDPAAHGDNTGEVTIGGNLEVAGGTVSGPSTLTIDPAGVGNNTGLVVIAGSLQVDGTTTTVNSTEMTVDDINIVLADGAANAAAADGGGITLEGANATITYTASGDRWNLNKGLDITGDLTVTGSIDATVDITAAGALEGASLDIGSGNLTSDSNGNLVVEGSTNLKGNVQIGNATSDTIAFTARASSDFIPSAHNTHDLGSTDLRWQKLYTQALSTVDLEVDNLTVSGATQGYILKQTTSPTSPLSFVDHVSTELNDVSNTGASDNQILKYDSTASEYQPVDHVTTELNDVSNTSASDNQILKYDSTASEYQPVDHVTTELNDVSNSAASDNDVLIYDTSSSQYAPAQFSLSNLIDISIADPAQGDLLVYQEADDKWHNKTKVGAGFADIAMSGSWADLSNTPTTIAGYGITDALTLGTTATTALAGDTVIPAAYADSDVDTHLNTSTAANDEVLSYNGSDYNWTTVASIGMEFSDLTSTPTTIAGYGITDALTLGTSSTTALAGDTVIPAAYADSDVDTHLNTSTAANDQVLSYNGSDYAWVSAGSVSSIAFGDLTSTPTTITGYGITDALTLGTTATTALAGNTSLFDGAFSSLSGVPGFAEDLADLGDVTISSLQDGQILKYDSADTRWENVDNTLSGLSDTDVGSPSNNEVLHYNSTSQNWESQNFSIGMLSNVDSNADSPTANDVQALGASPSGLMYKQSTSEWVVTAIELDDLYGVPDPASASASVGDVLAIKTLTHPQEFEWVSIDTIDGGTY